MLSYYYTLYVRNTTGVISGTGTSNPPGEPEFDPGFKWGRVARSLVFCVMFCRSLFVLLSFFFFWQFTAGNRHKQNSWFCKEIREDNFRFWWRRVHEDASQGMYMSKIEIFYFTARILQNQRMLCCGECFHD